MKTKIYTDTSVIGGCLDDEFKEWSNKLIDKFKQGEMTAIISELTMLELEGAPQSVRDILKEIPDENIEYIELTN